MTQTTQDSAHAVVAPSEFDIEHHLPGGWGEGLTGRLLFWIAVAFSDCSNLRPPASASGLGAGGASRLGRGLGGDVNLQGQSRTHTLFFFSYPRNAS